MSQWFVLARNIAKERSNAKHVIEDMIVQCFGGEDRYQYALEDPRVDWHGWFYTLELRLRIIGGFDASAGSTVAIERYASVSLKPGHEYKAVEKFLLDYQSARTR